MYMRRVYARAGLPLQRSQAEAFRCIHRQSRSGPFLRNMAASTAHTSAHKGMMPLVVQSDQGDSLSFPLRFRERSTVSPYCLSMEPTLID